MREWCLLLALLLGTAACGGSDGEAATPGTTESPATTGTSTTTTAEVDPFTVPDDPADIDEAYVEAVINEHNRVIGDALRIQLEGGDPKEIVDRYNAIYVPEVADLQLSSFFSQTEEELARYLRPPGNGVTEVVALREMTESCVVADVIQSAEELVVDPPAPFEASITILRSDSAAQQEFNRTGWISEGLTDRASEGGAQCDEA